MRGSGWTLTGNRAEYVDYALEFLRGNPIGNTVVLTNTERIRQEPNGGGSADCHGWWMDGDGNVRAALTMGTPGAVVMSVRVPNEAADELAQAWRAAGRSRPSGVFAQVGTGEHIASGFVAEYGGRFQPRPKHAMRLFSFAEPTPPSPAPRGSSRLATLDDLGCLLKWERAFLDDCGDTDVVDVEPEVRRRIERETQLLWVVAGEPVATAMHMDVVAGTARLSGVYTPPEHRRNGYAAGVTWGVTMLAQSHGARHVLLHTDLSNPTSNAVYQRLGYRPVQDVTEFEFLD